MLVSVSVHIHMEQLITQTQNSMPRSQKQIQSDINRTKAHMLQLDDSLHYSEEDKQVLLPHYQEKLTDLEDELEEAKHDLQTHFNTFGH